MVISYSVSKEKRRKANEKNRANKAKPKVCCSNNNNKNKMLKVPNIDLSKFLNCRVDIPFRDQLPVFIALDPKFQNCRVDITFKDQLPVLIIVDPKFRNCGVKERLPILFTEDPMFRNCRVNIDFKDQLPVLILLKPALKEKYKEPDDSKMKDSCIVCCNERPLCDPTSKVSPENCKRSDTRKDTNAKSLRPRQIRNYAESSLEDSAKMSPSVAENIITESEREKNNGFRIPVYKMQVQDLDSRKIVQVRSKNSNDVYEFDSDSENLKKKKANKKKLNESSAYDEDIKKAMSNIRRKEKRDCNKNKNVELVVANFKNKVNNKKLGLGTTNRKANCDRIEHKPTPPITSKPCHNNNNNRTIILSSGDDNTVVLDLSINNSIRTENDSIINNKSQQLREMDIRNIKYTDTIYKTPPDKIKEPDLPDNNSEGTSFDDDSFTEEPLEIENDLDDWGSFSDNLPIANSTMVQGSRRNGQRKSHPWRLSMENAAYSPYLLKIKENALPELLQDSVLDATFEEKITHRRKPEESNKPKSPVKKSTVQKSIRDYVTCKLRDENVGEKENVQPRLSIFDGGDLSPVKVTTSNHTNRIESVKRNILSPKNNNVIVHSVVQLSPFRDRSKEAAQVSCSSKSGSDDQPFVGFSPEVVSNSRNISKKITKSYQDLCNFVDDITGGGGGESKSKNSCFGFNSANNTTTNTNTNTIAPSNKDQPKPSRISINTIKNVIRSKTNPTPETQSSSPMENIEEFEVPTPVTETSETLNIFEDLKPMLPSKTYNSKYRRKRLLSESDDGFDPIEDQPAVQKKRKQLQSIESESKKYHKKKKDIMTAHEKKEFEKWVQKMNAEFQEIDQSVLEVDG